MLVPSTNSLSPSLEEKSPGVTVDTDPDAEFGGPEARKALERKLLIKLDLRMSILIVIFILNFIDRNNAAAARLRGLETDLKLKGQEFPTLLSILYVGYIIMQIPSNMFLNWVGKPSLYLPFCMLVWGMISVLTGITTNFVGALLTRFFLGFAEAAFFPGALFLISKWYKRNEVGLRSAILYCGSIISNAFGSLIASGILSNMDGKLGHAAWRWLFFIEGALTIFFAILAIFILPDFPTTTSWLTDEERRLAIRRLEEDTGIGEAEEQGNVRGLWLAITDWKVWWMSIALVALVIALSFSAFFPTLSATMGYNPTVTLLLCAPPFIVAAIWAFFWAIHSDKTEERFFHIVSSLSLGTVGFIISIATMNTAARYVALFLVAQSYGGCVVYLAWISNSVPSPPSKRAVALAIMNGVSQLGNVAGSYIWPTAWGPSYRNSYAITIANAGVTIIMAWILRVHLRSLNLKLDREEEENGIKKKGFSCPRCGPRYPHRNPINRPRMLAIFKRLQPT